MDISMDIHEKSVDMDMDVIFHIHGNHGFRSLNNSTSKRVLNLLESVKLNV